MQIHLHARQGDIVGVARELSQGVPIDCINQSDLCTPLMAAVTSPSAGLDTMRFLIEAGADINAVGGHDQEPVLDLAVRSGDLDTVRLLLDAGADIKYTLRGGYDALLGVVSRRVPTIQQQRVALIELLTSRGAPTDGLSDYGESALRIASHSGQFEVVRQLLVAGADAAQLKWTDLMSAVALGGVQDVKRLLAEGADLSARDCWSRTPWLLSLEVGDLEKAKLLLAAGARPEDKGHCGKPALMYAVESRNRNWPLLPWLLEEQLDLEATDDFGATPLLAAVRLGATDRVRLLLQAGASTKATKRSGRSAINAATRIDIVRLLLDVGEDLNAINDTARALLTGLSHGGPLEVSAEDYASGKHRRFGNANPEVMDVAFWKAMVRSGATAKAAMKQFHDTETGHDDSGGAPRQSMWCFDRFGKSITELPDGRFIEVGGEHEDHYMPEFCIYNDVVVHHGEGLFDILGYPRNLFPPTDFHSATLIGNSLYLIGSLGYPSERRHGQTPVYCLNCETLAMEKIETHGEQPGWINRHKATLHNGTIVLTGGKVCALVDGKEEYLDNTHAFVLDLASMDWQRTDAALLGKAGAR